MIVFLALLGVCYSLEIAYLKTTSDLNYNPIFDKFKDFNDGFNFKEYTYSDENDFKIATKNIVDDGRNLAFVVCTEEMFDWKSNELSNNKLIIWCLNTVSTGRCSKSFISGISVIPVIDDLFSIISIIDNGKVALLMGAGKYDKFYLERFEYSAHLYGITIVYNATESTYDATKYKEALMKYPKTATLTTFSKTKIEQVITDRAAGYNNNDKHPIVYLPGGITFDELNPANDMINLYISGYTGNEDDPNYIIGNYSLNKDPSSFDKVVLIGILTKLFELSSKYPATEIHTFLSLLYDKPIEYLGGTMYLLSNHYLSTPFYLVERHLNSFIIAYTIKEKKSFIPNQYYGKLETEGCNFLTSQEEDGKETLSYLPIGFVIRTKDFKMKLIRIFLHEMINRFEDELLGMKVTGIPIDSDTDVETMTNKILDFYNESNLHTLFVFTEADKMKDLATALRPYDIQLFYIGETIGDYCENNVIFGNFLTSSYAKMTADFVQKTNDFNRMIIVGTRTEYGETSVKLLVNELVSRGFNEKTIVLSYMIDNDEYSALNVTRTVSNMTVDNNNDKVGVFVVVEELYFNNLFKAFNENNINIDNNFSIITYNLDESFISENDYDITFDYNVSDYYFLGHSSNNMKSELIDPYRNYFKTLLGKEIPICPEFGLIINVFSLLQQSIQSAYSFLPSYYTEYIYHQAVQNPAYDQYEIYYSGYAQGKLRLFQLKERFDSDHILDQISNDRVFVIHNKTVKCSYSNGVVQLVDFPQYKIGLIYDKYTYINNVIMDYLNVIFDIINQDGGINGREVIPLYFHYKSIEELKQQIKSYENDSSVLFYCGTKTSEERDALSDILIKQDKLLFSLIPSGGEVSYQNIIQANSIPNQNVPLIVHVSFALGFKQIIVYYTDDRDSKNIFTYFQEYTGAFNEKNYVISLQKGNHNFTAVSEEILKYADENHVTVTIITCIKGDSYEFVKTYRDYKNTTGNTMADTIIISDYTEEILYSAEDIDYLDDVYFTSIYSTDVEVDDNILFLSTIQEYKGDNKSLTASFQLGLYDALIMMKAALEANPDDLTSYTLRTYFYNNVIKSPQGEVKVFKNNYMSLPSYLQYFEKRVIKIFSRILSPIKPNPYLYLIHDNKYITSDFSVDPPRIEIEDSIMGIAIIFPITGSEYNLGYHYTYLAQFELIASFNHDGGVQGRFINYELHDCPTDQDNAAALLIRLQQRSIQFIISNCDHEIKDAIIPALPQNSLFMSVGYNNGNQCQGSVYYFFPTQNQVILPFVLYIANLKDRAPISLIYMNVTRYKTRIHLMKSMLEGLELSYNEYAIDNNNFDKDLSLKISDLYHSSSTGALVIALFYQVYAEQFFEKFYSKICKLYSSNEECVKKYRVYMLHENHLKFNEHAEGHYIITPFLDDGSESITKFLISYSFASGNETFPDFTDILVYDSLKILINAARTSPEFSTDAIKKQLYEIETETELGTLKFYSNNHLNLPLLIGKISPNGYIIPYDTISKSYQPEPYYTDWNPQTIYLCNIKDGLGEKYTKELFNIGVVLPYRDVYFQDSIPYFAAIKLTADRLNLENGGILNKYINVIAFTATSDNIKTRNTIMKFVEEYNTYYFFGGVEKNARVILEETTEEINGTIFIPIDYEGKSCCRTCFYYGIPTNSYYVLLHWIIAHTTKNLVLLYSKRTFSESLADHLKKELSNYQVYFDIELALPLENNDMDSIVNFMQYKLSGYTLLVSLLEGPSASLFITSLAKYKLLPPKYVSINMNLDEADAKEIGDAFNGHYYINSVDVNDEIGGPLRAKYDSEFFSKFSFIISIDQNSIRGEVGIEYLSTILIKAGSTDKDAFKKFAYSTEVDTILGRISFESNNNLKSKLLIWKGLKMSEGEKELDYMSQQLIINLPFISLYTKSNLLWCDIENNNYGSYEPYYVGLLYSISGLNKERDREGLYGALTALHERIDLGPVNNHIVLPIIINLDSSRADVKNEIIKVIEEYDVKILLGCSDTDCKEHVQNVLNDYNNLLFFYPEKFIGQECRNDTFYLGLLPNQYVSRLLEYLITVDVEKSLLIVTGDDVKSAIISKILRDEGSGMFTTAKEDLVISDSLPPTIDRLSSSLQQIENGGIIAIVLFDENNLQLFINNMETLRIDRSKYLFVDFVSDEEKYLSFKSSSKHDIYLLSHYFHDVDTDTAKIFNTLMYQYTYSKNPTAFADSSYAAIKLWMKAVEELKSDETEAIKIQLINKTCKITDGNGDISFTDSHFISLPFFVAKFDKNGEKLSTVFSKANKESPMPWSWNIDETFGYMCSFDPKSRNNNYYKIEAAKVVLESCLTGELMEYNLGEVDAFKMAIDEINESGGVKGMQLKTQIYDTLSKPDICVEKLSEFAKSKPLAIFFSGRKKCIDNVENDIVSNNILVFFVYKFDINHCKSNIFVASDHISLYDEILDVLSNRFYTRFLLAFMNIDDLTNQQYVSNYLNRLYLKVDNVLTQDSIAIYMKEYVELKNKKERICMIFQGTLDDYTKVKKEIDKYDFREPFFHIVVSDPTATFLLSDYNGYEIIHSYRLENDSPVNEKFKNNMFDRIDKKTVYLNDIVSSLYSSVKIWAKAINTINSTEIGSLRKQLRQTSLDSPEGEVKFSNNQYMGKIMMLSWIDENKVSRLVYSTKYAHFPSAYEMINDYTKYKTCDFDNPLIGDGGEVSTYLIGIITSFSGINRFIEKPIFDAVISGITYINSNEPLLNKYQLYYKAYDLGSDRSNYHTLISKILSDSSINYIFGGYDADDFDTIVDEMSNSKKLFFFCGHVYSKKCPKNVIVSELHPSQIALATVRRVLQDVTSVLLVHSLSNFTISLNDFIVSNLGYMNLLLMGNIEYNLDNENTESQLKQMLQGAAGNGGYIIVTLESKEYYVQFFKDCYKLGIKYPKYTIISTLFDENIFNDLSSEYLSGHRVIGSYFESLSDISLTDQDIPTLASTFLQELHINIGEEMKARTQYESAFALLLYWKNMVASSNSVDIDEIKILYEYYVDVPSGTIELSPNHIFKRNIYSGYITNENQIYIDWKPSDNFNANIYNQWNSEYIGHICDWKNYNSNDYFIDPIHIAFIHEIDVGGKTEQYNLMIEDMAINLINEQDGVNGRNLVGDHYFLTFNKIYTTTRSISTETEAKAIFGCMTSKCRDEVARYLDATDIDIIFYYIGRDNGNICNNKVISTGSTITQNLIPLVSYVKEMGVSKLYVVGNEENSTKVIVDAIVRYLPTQGIKFLGSFLNSAYNTNSYSRLISDINNLRLKDVAIATVVLYVGKESNKFLETGVDLDIDLSSLTLIQTNYDPADFSTKAKTMLSGSYIVSNFADSVSTTSAKSFSYSVAAQFQKSFQLTELLETSYSSLYLWKSAIEYASKEEGTTGESQWPTGDYIKLSLKYVSFNSPSGKLVINYNNHATKSIYIFRYTSGSLVQAYPKNKQQLSINPNLTYLSSDDCIMGKKKSVFEYSKPLQILIIVMMIVIIVVCIASAGLVFSYKHMKFIRTSSPLFLYYSLFALILLSISGFIFTLVPNWGVCFCRVWLLALSIDLLFGIFLCKAWRIHKLFNNKDLQRVKISNMMLIKIILLIEIVQIIYLTIWWIIDPSIYTAEFSVEYSSYLEDVYRRECTENDIFTFIEIGAVIVMFLYGVRLAWKTRKATSEFNESMTLASMICVMLILGILEIPLNLMMSKQPDTLMMMRGLGVELGVIAVLLLQFASKISSIFLYAMTTTAGSSSTSASNSKKTRSLAKQQANRGRFSVKPNVLIEEPLAMCTISFPYMFYNPANNCNSSSHVRQSVRDSRIGSNRISSTRNVNNDSGILGSAYNNSVTPRKKSNTLSINEPYKMKSAPSN